MTITPQLEAELAEWLDTYWKTYLSGDLVTWATFIKDDYYNIGGTKEEIWHSKQEILDYTYAIMDQMVGQAEVRNRKIDVIPYADRVMVNEFTDLYVKIDGKWSFYGPFRMSSLLEKTDTGWIALHQHGSYPDMKATEGEAFAADALRAENLRLQEAVDQRTQELVDKNRELEIESALERVRAVAMGMKKPQDMLAICRIISAQLQLLGVTQIRNIQTAIIDEQKGIYGCYQYFTAYDQEAVEQTAYLKSPVEHGMVRQMLASENAHFTNRLMGKELEEFRGHRKAENHFPDPLLDEAKELSYCFLSIGQGGLGLTLYQPFDGATLDLFKRFHHVFSLAYSRFRDIEKAEAQAREVEIELALERVRSRSLAMHNTSELQTVIHTVHKEFLHLNIAIHGGSFIAINSDIATELRFWGAGGTANTTEEVHLPLFEKPFCTNLINRIKSNPEFFTEEYTQREKKEFFTFLFKHEPWSKLDANQKKETLSSPGGYTRSCCVSQHTSIFIINHFGEKFSAADNDILKRFGKVFDQTYTRFLDLQKAEAQAREVEIELALEKIRAQSMAMMKSEDLTLVVSTVFKELGKLDVNTLRCGIGIIKEENRSVKAWITTATNVGDTMEVSGDEPLSGHPLLDTIFINWKTQKSFGYTLEGNDLIEYYKVVGDTDFQGDFANEVLSDGALKHFYYCVMFPSGGLFTFSDTFFSEDTRHILKRFADAFFHAYKRFEDLQKAEAQAREAQIEAALERVRSRTMGMHTSEEMKDLVSLVIKQLIGLGFKLDLANFNYHGSPKEWLLWMATPDFTYPELLRIPAIRHPLFERPLEAYKQGQDFMSDILTAEEFKSAYAHFYESSKLNQWDDPQRKRYVADGIGMARSVVFMKSITLTISNFQAIPYSEEQNQILKRFANAFEQAYIRFLDIQIAEAQAREAQIQLALERVRARTMAMQHSDELGEASALLFKQVSDLGIQTWTSGFNIWEKGDTSFIGYNPTPTGGIAGSYHIPSTEDPFFINIYEAKKREEDFFVFESAGESLANTYHYMKTLPIIKDVLKGIEDSGFPMPTCQINHCAFFTHGFLLFITLEPYPNAHDIFKRFGKVFEQTYTRFLDLQKAEVQAREAQIELAVERIRAKALAMYKSEEILSVAVSLREEMVKLNLQGVIAATIFLEQANGNYRLWDLTEMTDIEDGARLSLDIDFNPDTIDSDLFFLKFLRSTEKYLIVETNKADFERWAAWYRHYDAAGADKFLQYIQTTSITQSWHAAVPLEKGRLKVDFMNPPPKEMEIILPKMAAAFDLAYTRFLDIQKAEAQAREAKIELALERVRARTMAMQHSEELLEVATVLFQQVKGLGVPQWNCGFNIWGPGDEAFTYYPGSPDGVISPSPCKIPLNEHPVFRRFDDSRKKGIHLLVYEKKGEEQKDHYQYMLSLPGVGDLLQSMLDAGFELPTFQIDHLANFAYGNLIFITYEHFPEMHIVFKRFAKVFEQTYTRFLDLQKAEAQTREAQIEAALEKVRSRSLAMHKSDELSEVIVEVQRKFQELDISMESRVAVVVVFDKNSRNFNQWVASPDFSNIYISTPYFRNPILDDFWTAKEAGDDFYSNAYSLDVKNSYFKYFFENSNYENVAGLEEQKKWLFEQAFYAYSPAFEKNSSIGIADFSGKALTKREIEIIKRFAKVFEQAYVRFLDLQKAEAQIREVQIEAALEKVRSRSLAMHKSDELNEVVSVLFENLKVLQIPATAIGIGVSIEGSKDLNSFVCGENQDGLVITNYRFPYFDNIISKDLTKVLEEQLDFFVGHYSKEEKNSFYGYIIENTPEFRKLPEDIKQMIFESPSYTISSVGVKNAVFSLNDFDGKTLTEKEVDIIKRFARTFEQAFTRFLDLQKAEKQTREAQINLAVERVRARALAMFKSEEILEVVFKLKEEVIGLDIPGVAAAAILLKEKNGMFRSWDLTSLELNGESMHTPLDVPFEMEKTHPDFYLRKVWEKGTNYTVVVQDTKSLQITCDWLRDNNKVKEAEEAEQFIKDSGLQRGYHPTVPLNNGRMILDLLAPPADEIESILTKMGGAFDLAYKRFEDLKNSEEQLREARIEAALERVRSRSMAMHKSEELRSVVDTVYGEMQSLQVNFHVVGIQLLIDDSKDLHLWLSTSDGLYDDIIHWPFTDIPVFHEIYKAHTTGEMLKYIMSETTTREFFEQYFKVEGVPQERKMALQNVKVIDIAGAYQKFTGVFLMRYSEGSYSPYEKDIITRFSKVFEQTYTRFLDLQKAEAQGREAHIEASLERVRSKTMAMHNSNDVGETVATMFNEFVGLGIHTNRCGILIFNDADIAEVWTAKSNPEGKATLITGILQLKEHMLLSSAFDAWHAKEPFHQYILLDDDLVQYYNAINRSAYYPTQFDMKSLPDKEYHSDFYFPDGAVFSFTKEQLPEEAAKIMKRFAGVFGQTYRRYLDLQKAEAQTRESQVQLALERVRASSLAMHKSEELHKVINIVGEQIAGLGINYDSAHFIQVNADGSWDMWIATLNQYYAPKIHVPYFDNALLNQLRDAKRDGLELHQAIFSFEEKNNFFRHFFENTIAKSTAEERKQFVFQSMGIGWSSFPSKTLSLAIGNYQGLPYTNEDNEVFKRLSNVFDQAYIRFLDLQKAEAQAREAKIEMSLEKVRSRTMAMQHSNELPDAANLLFLEVQGLGIPAWSCGYNILSEDKKSATCIMSSEGTLQKPFQLRLWGEASFNEMGEFIQSDGIMLVQELGDKALDEHYAHMKSFPDLKPTFEDIEAKGLSLPTYQINHLCKFTQGFVLFITYEKVPEAHDIFQRFTKVFEQTYTRFLDLKKAEAQAKEAQVETSLERIRAHATAMAVSTDLLDIVMIMRKEFILLGHQGDYFWHMKWLSNTYEKAMTSGDGTRIGMIMELPRGFHEDQRMNDWEKSDEPIGVFPYDVDGAIDYVDKMIRTGRFDLVDHNAPGPDDIRAIGGITFIMARTTHGEIGFSLPGIVENPPQDALATLVRFAGVFDLAYRRFEDLLTSEIQNRKSKIELALERVRARALAMQLPEELIEVANVMREEMGVLGVEELETSSIYINKSAIGEAECWYSLKDIRDGATTNVADHFDLNYQDTWVGRQMLDFYQSDDSNTSILMQGENRKEWINYCAKQSPKLDGYYGTEIPERTYHLTKFSSGAIGAATPGEISKESWDLLSRAAAVFSLAYSRFKDLSQAREDLKKLKKAKAKAEVALKELKAAQEQLIQQEKLASLGQLTAGIAHEIKNPLNFVNNFSDLSRELIEEVFEELEKLESSATKEEIMALLHDVQSNLTKVHEHGTRANGIVSSMLQHSRASGSKREARPFNPIVKEFVNLSFHGMRAGKAPINVDIDLQLDPKILDVALISEDFSRVILNLCNNAFDAMREKFLKTVDGRREEKDGRPKTGDGRPETGEAKVIYAPKLTVKTALQKDKVILSIGDNGGGIPDEIKDKILQPFFTTKKGTEGTGLGLSITHDIVKAHGGEITIESISNTASTFTVIIPIKSEV